MTPASIGGGNKPVSVAGANPPLRYTLSSAMLHRSIAAHAKTREEANLLQGPAGRSPYSHRRTCSVCSRCFKRPNSAAVA